MKTLIRNALLVTMNRQNDVIENGSIVIDGNKLVYVGPTQWMPTGPFDKTIEGDRRYRHAWNGERSLSLAGESRARHVAEQAPGDLACLLPRLPQRYAR